jgi:hypothetical protein
LVERIGSGWEDSVAASWMAVGQAAGPESYRAGAQAAEAALTGPDPKLLNVFFGLELDAVQVLAGIRSVSGDVPLIGGPTAGEIACGSVSDNTVVVAALGGAGLTAQTAGVSRECGDSQLRREAGATAVAPLTNLPEGEHRFALLLPDAQAGNLQDIIRGAYGMLGAGVPLVGGCAANNGVGTTSTAPLLLDDKALEASVVAASVVSDNPFGIGLQHGWERTGDPLTVSSAEGAVVFGLDGQPALDLYLERLNAPAECWSDPMAFQKFALRHPLGIRRPRGDEIRVVAHADYEHRTVSSAADVPEDSVISLMRGDEEGLLAATDRAFEEAIEALNGRTPIGFLVFDCIGRRGAFSSGVTDVDRMVERAGGAPFAGFYSHGEIARTRGAGGFHHQALVVLAIS